MNRELPLHPSLRHPITGEPLRALYIDKNGRARYPIMGGAPDDPPKTDPPADPPKTDPPPADPPKADPPADRGFPENTPVAQMTVAQQAAYWQHQSRKHETRATEYREAVGGKSADEVKTVLTEAEKLRQQNLSDHERAVEEARKAGQTTAASEFGPKAVRAAFDLLLGDIPKEKLDLDAELDLLDLSKFLTDSGDVDTAKVRQKAGQIAPADKGTGTSRQPFDFGGGNRGDAPGKSGVSAGAELHATRRKSTPSTT